MNTLERLREASRLLELVASASDAKELAHLAGAAEDYARRAKLGKADVRFAHTVFIKAWRLFGAYWEKTEKHEGGRPSKTSTHEGPVSDTLKQLGVSKKEASTALFLNWLAQTHSQEYQAVLNGDKSLRRVRKDRESAAKLERQKTTADRLTEQAKVEFKAVCDLRHCSMQTLLDCVSPDCIITDPPYGEEYLPLYTSLAESAKDAPLIAVMCGQSYLPQILANMCVHLRYHWMFAYMTPGGQSAQLWHRKVNTFWKPILVFGALPQWTGDVVTSKANDNEKSFHQWGQSESGMCDLIERISKPGDLICDPFLGGGATALAALTAGRRFVGCDIDETAVATSLHRCEAFYAESGQNRTLRLA